MCAGGARLYTQWRRGLFCARRSPDAIRKVFCCSVSTTVGRKVRGGADSRFLARVGGEMKVVAAAAGIYIYKREGLH